MQTQSLNDAATTVAADIQSVTLGDLWQTIIRQKLIFLSVTAAIVFVGLVYCAFATKKYEAQAVVLLENQEKNLEIKAVLSEVPNDLTFIPSEIQVISSRNLMGRVLDDLGITKNPKMLGKKGPQAEMPSGDEKLTAQELAERRSDLIDQALRGLSVRQVEKSRAIEVSYQGLNAEMTAMIVNKLTDLYIDQQLRNSFEAIRTTNSWLAERVNELQKKVADSEAQVAAYRASAGLVNSGDTTQIQNDIADLSRKLTEAKTVLASSDSKLSELNSPESLESAPSILSSPLIQKLRDREADSRDELANLQGQFGPSHPKVRAASAQVAEIVGKIKSESDKIAQGMKRERDTAQANVAQLEAQLTKLQTEYNRYNSDNVKLAALEREAEANRKFLEIINLRWKETQSQEDTRLQAPYARVLSTAAVPDVPSRPMKKMVLLVCLIAGMGLGAAGAIAIEQMQPGIYNGKHLQEQTGTLSIAMVPFVKLGSKTGYISCADIPLREPLSPFMDGIRAVSTFLKLEMGKDSQLKIINFTSSAENEGKSGMVMGLARQLAIEGLRVVAVDCDLRHSTLTNTFGLMQKPGVLDFLGGQATLKDIVFDDRATNLKLIGVGHSAGTNAVTFGLDVWEKAITDIAANYDVVLIDSAPILSLPESKLLARIGKTIFCVRWQKTPIKKITFALDTLRRSEANLLGSVVTMVQGQIARAQGSYKS